MGCDFGVGRGSKGVVHLGTKWKGVLGIINLKSFKSLFCPDYTLQLQKFFLKQMS